MHINHKFLAFFISPAQSQKWMWLVSSFNCKWTCNEDFISWLQISWMQRFFYGWLKSTTLTGDRSTYCTFLCCMCKYSILYGHTNPSVCVLWLRKIRESTEKDSNFLIPLMLLMIEKLHLSGSWFNYEKARQSMQRTYT